MRRHNPSIERTSKSLLRKVSPAAHVELQGLRPRTAVIVDAVVCSAAALHVTALIAENRRGLPATSGPQRVSPVWSMTPSDIGSVEAECELQEREKQMPIELNGEARNQAVASIERYFAEEFDQRIGNIGAGALLNFFLEEIGPLVYNKAVNKVQERLQERVQELDIEFNEEEFQYWRRRQPTSKAKR